MSEYIGAKLNNLIIINRLYTVHYFEYSKDFKFYGESHNFWEFVYVDKGEVIACADEKRHKLQQGDIIFHKPGEWHSISPYNNSTANVAIVSFSCNSKAMAYFKGKIFKIGQAQKNIIAKIISEYSNAFSTPLNCLYSYSLSANPLALPGAEQLLKLYICEFLISLLRNDTKHIMKNSIDINRENSTLNMLINYMKNNIHKTITIDELVRYSGSNRTTISAIFRNAFGVGAIKYFISLKIEAAKNYIRENNYNITQISELLGYSGVHYFSRQFKKETGMSPIEYSNSINALGQIDKS